MNNMKKIIVLIFLINSITYGIYQPSLKSENSIIENIEDLHSSQGIGLILLWLCICVIFLMFVGIGIWYFFPTKIKTEQENKQAILDKNQNQDANQNNQANPKELFYNLLNNLHDRITINEIIEIYNDLNNFMIYISSYQSVVNPDKNVFHY